MKTITLFPGITVFAVVSCLQMVSAGELRPLVLPSTQQGYIQQQRPAEQPGSLMYKNFEADVRRMTPEQKQAFKDHYTRSLDEAVKENDYTRIQHFSRLLEILK
jgi:hypothetical protein